MGVSSSEGEKQENGRKTETSKSDLYQRAIKEREHQWTMMAIIGRPSERRGSLARKRLSRGDTKRCNPGALVS